MCLITENNSDRPEGLGVPHYKLSACVSLGRIKEAGIYAASTKIIRWNHGTQNRSHTH